MRTHIKSPFVLPVLMAVLGMMTLAGPVRAQVFTVLHAFTANSDGSAPSGGLLLSGNTLYGTAVSSGNVHLRGTVFKVNTNGTGFTTLHGFTGLGDGENPSSGLLLSGNTLYGTTSWGGAASVGTVFAVNTDGTGFRNLHSFGSWTNNWPPPPPPPYINGDGALPQSALILSGNTLFGTARGGGFSGKGTVFAINTNGTGFRVLHVFGSDGADPYAGLVLSGNTLYGTTSGSFVGNWSPGTVFKVNTDGTGFTNLYNFTPTASSGPPYYAATNSDGAHPDGGLLLSGSSLYGTAREGGNYGSGTVFKLNNNGTGFTVLHSFSSIPFDGPYTNSDGAYPKAGLILSGNTLFGTTWTGGTSGNGTVFAVNTDGTGFVAVYTFTLGSGPRGAVTNSDGAAPLAGLLLSVNTLYGTASTGGTYGQGTLFSLSWEMPQLTIERNEIFVVLSWPLFPTGFTLQSTTELGPSALWSTVFPGPVVVNELNTVSIPISGSQKFYRLIH